MGYARQLLYSRLHMCKEVGAELAAQKHSTLLANCVAVELGLDDPNGPAAVLAQTMEILGEQGATDNDTNVVYMYLIHACDKLFDNELDQATFEEHMRWFFGNKVRTTRNLGSIASADYSTVLDIYRLICCSHWTN